MAPSDSEGEVEDIEDDNEDDNEQDNEQDIDQDIEDLLPDDATEEGDDDSGSDDSDDGSDDEDDDEDGSETGDVPMDLDEPGPQTGGPSASSASSQTLGPSQPSNSTSPDISTRQSKLTPAQARRQGLVLSPANYPRTFTVEAVCAIPQPVPTHALAGSACMTHLITGSDDGYIRDYDIFAALNGKNLLTAPQRSHSGVVEGLMKAGQLRFWWENPANRDLLPKAPPEDEDLLPAPVFSLAMQSDALWVLAGTDVGDINLFTVRHQPGQLAHVLHGHRGHVSALALDHDEKGFFSAGWDGDSIQWDLNTGQSVRKFAAHGAQVSAIAVRPENALTAPAGSPLNIRHPIDNRASEVPQDSDARSDGSFDPLFDGMSDEEEEPPSGPAFPGMSNLITMPKGSQKPIHRASISQVPKNAPPILEPSYYSTFSPDLFITSCIDGQVILWDKRAHTPGSGVGRLPLHEKTPPWCLSACWSADGSQIYAGRRNGTVEAWDVRQFGSSGPAMTPRLLKTLRNPASSGVVSCVVAFPDSRHIACASVDNIRLWNVAEAAEPDASGKIKSGVQFKIIPGHHGGYISQMLVDPGARFLISASSNRGWHGDSTKTVFVHDIKHVR
ncbi:WD40 repeat-like protein [Mycena floridula]|nr:WD40 repeat-like protein [Mycena floridula]